MSMEMKIEIVVKSVKEVLPTLSKEVLNALALHLVDNCGVQDSSDLEFVKEEDLIPHLKPIQSRRLLRQWTPKEQPATPTTVLQQQPTNVEKLPAASSSESFVKDHPGPVHVQGSNWHVNFQIPWGKFGVTIKNCLEKKRRPHPKDRREMVRKLVDEIRLKCINPTRQQLSHLASAIIKQYPESFTDQTDDGEVIGSGFRSMLNQLKARVENLNRGNSQNVLRRAKFPPNSSNDASNSSFDDENFTPRKRKADSYGCINWQPNLNDDSSEDMLERRNKLKEEYSMGPEKWDRSLVDKAMSETYPLQRTEINSASSIFDVSRDWPFLFHERWLFPHFETLVGYDLRDKLLTNSKSLKVINSIKRASVPKDTRRKMDVTIDDFGSEELHVQQEFPTALILLINYFKEDMTSIIRLLEPTITATEVNEDSLPVTPCLLVFGDSVSNSSRYMMAVDQKVVCDDIEHLSTGLAMVFGAFYVCNIMYPEEAGTTLEFIHRCFVCINPETGSKVSKGVKKKKESVSPKVLSLIKTMSDSEWLNQH